MTQNNIIMDNVTKNNKGINKDHEPPDKQLANFETAISATGYGYFNFLLILVAIPCCFSTIFSTTTMAYILPNAECDLKLSLMDKGALNAVTYAGMISSAIVWGYLSDTLGRRKLMIFGYLSDSIAVLLCSLSQNVWTLMVFKFLSGFILCGPFAVLMSYLTEFHGAKHRPRIIMTTGLLFNLGSMVLPLLAWSVIPQYWLLNIGSITLKSWQIFLSICCLPSLTAGIVLIFMPESPKFLMAQGENEKALHVFQTIFKINTRKSVSDYSIKVLCNEHKDTIQNKIKMKRNENRSLSKWNAINDALLQIIPLFKMPLLKKSILIFTIQFCALMGLNTLRLWLPELFTMVSEANNLSDQEKTLCTMIMDSVNKSALNTNSYYTNGTCENLVVSDSVYMYTVLVGLVGLISYFIAITMTNVCGPKYILIFGLLTAGTLGTSLYWSINTLMTFMLTSLYVSIGSVCSTALLSIAVNIFPTTLRTMTVSLLMMCGRTGSLIGNILFPYFLSFGCFPPFSLVGLILIVCSALCTILPKNINKPLQ